MMGKEKRRKARKPLAFLINTQKVFYYFMYVLFKDFDLHLRNR